jgi:hypothetical protein
MAENHTLFVAQAESGWEVRHGKGGRVLANYASRSEAEAAARRTISSLGGGQVCVEVPDHNGSSGAKS